MDDALGVRRGEAVGDRRGDLRRLRPADAADGDPGAEVFALEQLGDGVREAVFGAEVVDRENVRVVELRDRLGFAFETFNTVGILRDLFRDCLLYTSPSPRDLN